MRVAGVDMVVRELLPSDRPFIATTWGRSYRERAGCSPTIFDAWHPRIIDKCLDAFRTVVIASAAVPTTVFAYVNGAPHVLNWTHTIPELRNRGLSTTLLRELIGDGPFESTHRLPKPRQGVTFNPMRIGVLP